MAVKYTELKQKPKPELLKMRNDFREKLRQFRFDKASGKLKNIKETKEAKKEIARILTALNEAKK